MDFTYEIIPITFIDGTPVERDQGTERFILGLLNRRDAGRLVIPMQGLNVFNEMAKNTGDHTTCQEAFFAYAQFEGVGRFLYFDEGGGPQKPWEWCLREGNSTGDTNTNCGLGLPTIFEILSKPIGMKVEVIRSGKLFGYTGTWPLMNEPLMDEEDECADS